MQSFGTMHQIPQTNLFIGDQWSSIDLNLLSRNGITHILNTTPVNVPYPSEIMYYQVPMHDEPGQDLLSNLENALDYIDRVISQGGRVLIHCQAGKSRSASVLIAYLMWKFGLSYVEAHRIVKTARPVINPNYGFVEQLLHFENMLKDLR